VVLTILLALSAGLLGGSVVAGLVYHLLLRHGRSTSFDQEALDPDLDRRINQAAHQWATAQGRSAVAPLVARKLRLAYVLNRRRSRRRYRRSSW
jgi:hypothetical protein